MDFLNTVCSMYPNLNNTYTDLTFTYLNINQSVPKQGWKIHVSATYTNYFLILNECISCCIENDVDMKFLKDLDHFTDNISKNTPRAYSGKFITIYPSNLEKFKDICEKLYHRLKDFQGPYILSDKRYKDCKVLYYRYGRCQSDKNESEIEKKQLTCPDGSYIEDKRTPYYSQPYFVQDPFLEVTQKEDSSNLLNNKYQVKSVIHYSNTGGVYLATDIISNRKVIIKEARPYIEVGPTGDCVDMRKKELFFFELFPQYCPRVYDSFYEWEHFFIVVEFIEGITLSKFSDRSIEEIYFDNDNNVYQRDVKKVVISLIEMLVEIHKFGVIINDISNTNIMIKNGKLVIVDFEGGCLDFENQDFIVKTPGFDNGTHYANKFERDYVSLGSLIINLFIGTNQLAQLDQNAALKTFYLFANNHSLDPYYYLLVNNLLLNPDSINLEIELNLMKKNTYQAVTIEYKDIREKILKDNISDINKLAIELIDSKKIQIDLADLIADKELLILSYLIKLCDKKINVIVKDILSVNKTIQIEKTNIIDCAHSIILLSVMLPKKYRFKFESKILQYTRKIITTQNNNGSFISENKGVEGEGLIDGSAIIIFSLIESYRLFHDESIKNSIVSWLNYTKKYKDNEFPRISQSNLNKSPYLANGKSGLLLAQWFTFKEGFGTEDLRNEVNQQIKRIPIISSNVSFGYGMSGIAFLKIITNNTETKEYSHILSNLLSYKVRNKGENRYPNYTNSAIEVSLFTGEIGILFFLSCILKKLEE